MESYAPLQVLSSQNRPKVQRKPAPGCNWDWNTMTSLCHGQHSMHILQVQVSQCLPSVRDRMLIPIHVVLRKVMSGGLLPVFR